MKTILGITFMVCFAFQCNSVLGQSLGTVVDSGKLYSSRGGLVVSYTTTYAGSEPCGKKYRVTISINNGESFKVNVAGSIVDLDTDYHASEQNYSACSKDARLMFGSYPGYESWRILNSGFSDSNSHVIYMKSTTALPHISANVVPRPA